MGIVLAILFDKLRIIWGSFGDRHHLGFIWVSFGDHLGIIWISFGSHLEITCSGWNREDVTWEEAKRARDSILASRCAGIRDGCKLLQMWLELLTIPIKVNARRRVKLMFCIRSLSDDIRAVRQHL